MNCRRCHRPLHTYFQPTRAEPLLMAECHTPGCDLEFVTRSLADLRAMSEAEMDTYKEANARWNERRRAAQITEKMAPFGECGR